MARNVGPSRLEAQIGKGAKRHAGRLMFYVLLGVVVVLGLLSMDYASAYSGVIEQVGLKEISFRGRKNRGVRTVQEKCLVYRVYGEDEPRVDCRLPDRVLAQFSPGDRFVKPRFVNRPLPIRPPAEEGGEEGAEEGGEEGAEEGGEEGAEEE